MILALAMSCGSSVPPMRGHKPPPPPAPTGSVLEVTDSAPFVCALFKGRVDCAGNGFFNLLFPRASAQPGALAYRVMFPAPVVALASGETHACGLTVEGDVFCFDGDRSRRPNEHSIWPLRIPIAGRIAAISARGDGTCALQASSGQVMCWSSLGRLRNAPQLIHILGGEAPNLNRDAVLSGVSRLNDMTAFRSGETFMLSIVPFTRRGSYSICCGECCPADQRPQYLWLATSMGDPDRKPDEDDRRCRRLGDPTPRECPNSTVQRPNFELQPRGTRCTQGPGPECCGLSPSGEIACWSWNRPNVVMHGLAGESVDVGSGVVCAATRVVGSACDRVVCGRLLPVQEQAPDEPLEPLLYHHDYMPTPLCVEHRQR